ncbi:MAG: hypothetical protein ACI4OF_15260, partial [Falsigemmobacter intermedius]
GRDLVLIAGDEMDFAAASTTRAGRNLDLSLGLGTAAGARLSLDHALWQAATITLQAGAGDDRLSLVAPELIGNVSFRLGAGDDRISIDGLNDRDLATHLLLDGQAGHDLYHLRRNSAEVGYVITIANDGDLSDGLDRLEIDLRDHAADTTLIRHNFIGLLNETPEGGIAARYERINYGDRLALVQIRAHGGDDSFLVDGTSTVFTLDGGAGNDLFRIGQLYGAERSADFVGAGDVFATRATTAGYLSEGNSHALSLHGGSGDDSFEILSNRGLIRAYGDAGDDRFELRAFRAAAGGDLLQNAGVTVTGGSGANSLSLLGTEGADSYLVSADAVYGGGRSVSHGSVIALSLDGREGDDHFAVQSTRAEMVTRIIGGGGSDSFTVASDVTAPVYAQGALAAPGMIHHGLVSEDAFYHARPVPSLPVHLTGLAGAALVEYEHAGVITLAEGGLAEVWRLRLTRPISEAMWLTLSAVPGSSQSAAGGALLFGNEHSDTLLGFDAQTWNDWQTVTLRLSGDGLATGAREGIISAKLSTLSGAVIAVLPDLVLELTDRESPDSRLPQAPQSGLPVQDGSSPVEFHQVAGGLTLAGGGHVSYGVTLTKAPTAPVELYLNSEGALRLSSSDSRYDAVRGVITFTAENWDQPVVMTLREDTQAQTGAGGQFHSGLAQQRLDAIRGPLELIADRDQTAAPAPVRAVMPASERDVALPQTAPLSEDSAAFDRLVVLDAGATADRSGTLSETRLTGFGLGQTAVERALAGQQIRHEAGILYQGFDLFDLRLGQGDDRLDIASTALGTVTVVHGGAGDDHLRVVSQDGRTPALTGGADRVLILLGDSTQDGMDYLRNPAWHGTGAAGFTLSGNDRLEAGFASGGVILYGGAGHDHLTGSAHADQILGGSGNDTLIGGGGSDHLYGDNGLRLDLSSPAAIRSALLTITAAQDVTAADFSAQSGDTLARAGDDVISTVLAEGEHAFILADFGRIGAAVTGRPDLAPLSVSGMSSSGLSGGADQITVSGPGRLSLIAGLGHDNLQLSGLQADVLTDTGSIRITAGEVELQSGHVAGQAEGDDSLTGQDLSLNLIAGLGADVVTLTGSLSYIVADAGRILRRSDGSYELESTPVSGTAAGNDRLSETGGHAVWAAGSGDDHLSFTGADLVLIGDDGLITRDAEGTLTLSATAGSGNDSLTARADGNVVIAAGLGDDTLTVSARDAVVLADDGELSKAAEGAISLVASDAGGDDAVTLALSGDGYLV